MKLKDLVKHLQKKLEQDDDVEYIICTKQGRIVCMDVESQAGDIAKALKLFKRAAG